MSGSGGTGVGGALPISLSPLWTWNTSTSTPILSGFANGSPTKTGLLPTDVQNFAGVPLVRYGTAPVAMSDLEIIANLRTAEDWVEQQTGLLLTPTMVASPPARTAAQAVASNVIPNRPGGGLIQGLDYDLADAAYDFKFDRAIGDGWMIQSLRYKPLRIVDGSVTAIKQMAYVYPLLNDFFQIPVTWFVEDLDYGTLRVVPQENVQALPLFSLQIALQGFANSVPGGIWMQYTAGLTQFDYMARFGFIRTMVLCEAAAICLGSCQGTVNQGLAKTAVLTDGVQTQFDYRPGGAYSDLIKQFRSQRDSYLDTALAVVGPVMEVF